MQRGLFRFPGSDRAWRKFWLHIRLLFTYTRSVMGSGLELRDPIHGFIYREPLEQRIIDTCVFQRLRRLRQLAMESLVYPGAVHTRFDHSIGALHIARALCAKLLPNEDTRRIVRLAALLHDIGHGPFSHVSEPLLQGMQTSQRLRLRAKTKLTNLFLGGL
jgi:HD superfamily phosphohydrolase